MAIIYSYPIATPKSKDLLIGTSVFDENDPSSERTNPTVSFTVQSLINLIGPIIGTPNLQQVTGAGNTTTNSITIANSLSVNGSYIDSYGQSGSNGQVLTSQGTGTQTKWLASSGGVTSITPSDSTFITITQNATVGAITTTSVLSATGLGGTPAIRETQYLRGDNTWAIVSTGTTYQAGAGLTLDTSTTPDTFKVDYLGTDNIILSAGTAVTPVGGDTIIINDATTGNVVKALISNLPFDTYNKWVLTGDNYDAGVPATSQDILSGNTVDIAGGTYITTAASATDTLTVTHDATTRPANDTSDVQPDFGATFTAIDSITTNSTGHVTLANLKTVTIPSTVFIGPADATTDGIIGIVPAPAQATFDGGYFLRQDATWSVPPDTKLTTITTSSGTVSTGTPLTGSINAAGEVLTITSKYFGGGSNIGYVPANTDGTQFLRGDGNWASIPTGLNYEGVWEAGTIGTTSAPISGTTITITTAPTQTLVVGMRVTGTGINPGTTVLISSVTSQTEVVVDTSVSIGISVQVTFSTAGGFPNLTATGTQGDGILYICTVQGFASPNGFGTPPSFWNVGDWCVYSGTAGSGEWTRVPATNAGVTSFTSNFTSSGAGDTQFIGGNTLSGVAGAVDIGRINLNATASTGNIDNTKYLRGDNVWDTRISAVNSGDGLQGGGTSGSLTLSPRYTTDANIILSAPSGSFGIATTSSGATNQTQLTFSASNSLEIQAGMIAGQSALGNNIGTVDSINTTTGVVTFTANLGVAIGSAETVYFSSVITGSSQLLINNGTGASISEYNSYKALSSVNLGLFNNDQGWTNNVGTLTGIDSGLGIKIDDGSTATPEVNVRYLNITGANNIIVASPYDMGTDDPDGNDLLLLNDETDGKAKKLSLTTLSGYLAIGDITAVTAGNGLSGGGTSGDVTLNVEYDTDGNVILESFSGDFVAVTTVGGATNQTQLQFSAANIAKIKPGMVAGTTALGTEIGTVSSSTGTTVTFTANLGVTIGAGANVNFSSVITSSSQLMFNAGTGASISEFVSHKALSTVDLGLFNNDQGWNNASGTLTGVTGAAPLYSVTTGGGSATVPQIKLRYNEDTAGNNDSIITAAPAFGAGTADPSDLIIISDQSTNLNETKKIALSQLGFATGSGDITAVAAGDGLTGGGTSGDVTVSVMYTGTDNVILDATASTNIESSSKMMVSYDNGGGTIAAVNQMSLSDIPLGLFNNNLGWVALGNTATTALAGNTTTITTAQANEITANTAKTGITTAQADAIVANTAKVGITTAQANAIVANTAKVSDTGIPAVITSGANPGVTSLYANTAAGTVRATIGAGRTDTITMPNTGPGEGGILLGETADATTGILTYTVGVDYLGADNIISTAYAGSGTIPTTAHIMWAETTGTKKVYYSDVADLPFASSSASGTVTSISALNAGVLVSASTTTPTVGVNYGAAGAGGTNLILEATDKTGIAPQGSDQILVSDTVNSVLERYEIDDLPFSNNAGTVTSVAVTAGTGITASVATSTTTPNITITNSAPDTGVPAILSNGTVPTLNSGITAAEVRTLIGAGTSSTTGTVTSVGGTGTVSGLTLTGTVTSTGNLTLGGTLSLTSANVTDGLGFTPYNATNPAGYTTNTGTVTGTGTANRISKWSTGGAGIENSIIQDDGTRIGIGTTPDAVYTALINDATSGYKHIGANGDVGFYTKNEGVGTANILYQADALGGFGGNTTVFTVNSSGTLEVKGDIIAFGTPSDRRLKENIKPIESALSKAMKLQGVTFDWKEKEGKIIDIKQDIGFIAQDVQKVLPELVKENVDGKLSMRHQGIAPILLEAIKELKQEIEELKLNKCNCNK
jgi:hypothetical protein